MEIVRIWNQDKYANGVAGDEELSYETFAPPEKGDFFQLYGEEWLITKRIFKVIDGKALIDVLAKSP